MRLVCDIETDGLDPTLVHCLCVEDLDSTDNWQFHGDDLEAGLKVLEAADETIWHNGISYDIPALKKIYPRFHPKGAITDTLVLARMMQSDIKTDDFNMYWHQGDDAALPRKLYGSHSLRAWGLRMGLHKGDYDGGWDTFSEEMLEYCIQDVKVTKELYRRLKVEEWDQVCIQAEHRCHAICDQIGKYGWTFDTKKAGKLYAELSQRRAELENSLGELFEPWEIYEWFTPKVNNKKLGYVKGEPFKKTKTVYFNPNSRRHIEHCLKSKYGWKPKKMTVQGHAQIDDVILSELPYPEAKILGEFFMIQKRIGQLAEGKAAWLKLVTDNNKLHHQLIAGGSVSGRCVHRSPNLAQVPAVRLQYGKECRELFTVDDGYSLVGSDLSGLELRCLAHFMGDQDYIDQIEGGDIHTYNMKMAGLSDRSQAKTMIYCLIYGGGDARLGAVVDGTAKQGAALRSKFLESLPAFGRLKNAVDAAAKRGFLKGIDGRKVRVRSEHSAFNLLLQSTGATIARHWVINIQDAIEREGLDAHIVAWVHDEVQVAVKKGQEDYVGNLIGRMAEEAGRRFDFKIPIRSEFTVGQTWAETH